MNTRPDRTMVPIRSAVVFLALGLGSAGFPIVSHAQEGPLRSVEPPIPVEEIIAEFAAKESEFRIARSNYVYRQDILVQELDPYDDSVLGDYRLVSDIGFEPDGVTRTEKILFAPQPTLPNLNMSQEDLHDIREIQPFVLATEDLHLYDVKYVGKQKIDEIDNYVFDVAPKKIEEGERYFQGRIWVDDLDLQIVKTYGKAVPDIRNGNNENLFPRFETYRQQVDGYWFPTYIRALETLHFTSGPLRMRQVIRYDNYRRYQADVQFTVGEEVEEDSETTPAEAPPDR